MHNAHCEAHCFLLNLILLFCVLFCHIPSDWGLPLTARGGFQGATCRRSCGAYKGLHLQYTAVYLLEVESSLQWEQNSGQTVRDSQRACAKVKHYFLGVHGAQMSR